MRRRLLAGAAVALGLLAALAGDRMPAAKRAGVLAAGVEEGRGRLGIVELARWIRDQRPGLHVVDLRPVAEYDAFHLPGAVARGLTRVLDEELGRSGVLVLYGDDALAAQAWVLLSAAGWREAYWVPDALRGWAAGIQRPVLPSDATDVERAEWLLVEELSRYFGGEPTIGGPRQESGTLTWASEAASGSSRAEPRRRGCGF